MRMAWVPPPATIIIALARGRAGGLTVEGLSEPWPQNPVNASMISLGPPRATSTTTHICPGRRSCFARPAHDRVISCWRGVGVGATGRGWPAIAAHETSLCRA